jgi:hypothetical protein
VEKYLSRLLHMEHFGKSLRMSPSCQAGLLAC